MLGKLLGYGRMHDNKTFFIFLNKNFFIFFLLFSRNFRENQVFCTGFISYSVSSQPNIKQNW